MAAAGVQAFPTSTRATAGQRRGLSGSVALRERPRAGKWRTEAIEEHPLNDINDTLRTIERSARRNKSKEAEQVVDNDAGETEAQTIQAETSAPEEGQQQSEYVPWYLQAQNSIEERPENPLTARQRIPDLPEHSPSILPTLLEHVSVELGMDDLSILDLRSLDPPPALGANLFMIVGTARSEKHLHVSADRLCRWLRTTYQLRPYADGLLGRNELKLKMRRKAKRSKLFTAVGAKATTESEDIDDGIRTGWVCVNVGKVEGGELPKTEERIEREKMVVGFGTQTGGSNVVVQMLTEEKRGEIDLENLWTETLRRARVKKEMNMLKDEAKDEDAGDEHSVSNTATGDASEASLSPFAYVSNQDATEQLRA